MRLSLLRQGFTLYRWLVPALYLLAAGCSFYLYSWFRAHSFSGSWSATPLARSLALFSIAAVPLSFTPLMVLSGARTTLGQFIRGRSIARGLCAACGYPQGDDAGRPCPECGSTAAALQAGEEARRRNASRMFMIQWIGLLAVCYASAVLGEAMLLADEAAFLEAAARNQALFGPGPFLRPRDRPLGGFTLVSVPGSPVFVND